MPTSLLPAATAGRWAVLIAVAGLACGTAAADPPAELKPGKAVAPVRPWKSGASEVAFSPDGKTLLARGAGTTTLFDADTGAERVSLPRNVDPTGHPFSPDGKTVAALAGRELATFDAATGRKVGSVKPPAEPHRLVAASADRTTVAGFGSRGELKVWDAATGKVAFELQRDPVAVLLKTDAAPLSKSFTPAQIRTSFRVAYSPDGTLLASNPPVHPDVTVWDLKTGKALCTITGKERLIPAMTFSPDGKTLAVAHGTTGEVSLWDPATGRKRASLLGLAISAKSISFSGDGKRLAAACGEYYPNGYENRRAELRVWEVATGETVAVTAVPKLTFISVAMGPDGRTLATAAIGTVDPVALWTLTK